MPRGRPPAVKDEEFLELWKRTKGNLMEIARIVRPDRPSSVYDSVQRAKRRLEKQGLLIPKQQIKKEEVAPLITEFDQIPEIIEWRKYMFAKGIKEKTIYGRLLILRQLWNFLGKKRPNTINLEDVMDYVAKLREEKKYLFSKYVAIRSWFKFLAYKGYLPSNLLQQYLAELETKGLKGEPILVYLTREEFERLENALISLFDDEYYKKLIRAMIWVKVTTGIRTGDPKEKRELCGLTMDKMRIIGEQVIFDGILAKKNEIWNDVRPSPQACRYLLEYLSYKNEVGLGKCEYVFCNSNGSPVTGSQLARWFREARKIAGITKPCTPHTLRKTYLSWLVSSGVPLEIAIDLNVGWKDIATAKKYYLVILNRNKEKSLNDLWTMMKL